MLYYTSNELVLSCGSSEMFINTLYIVWSIIVSIGLSIDGSATPTELCKHTPSQIDGSDAKDKYEFVELRPGNLDSKSKDYLIDKAIKLLLKNRPRKSVNLHKAISQENHSSSEDNDLLYLDIGVYGNPDLYKEGEIQLTERNLLECLNFQVMLFGLKNHHGSEIPEPMKRFQNMSYADLVIAVRKECDQPLQFAKKSFTDKEKPQKGRIDIQTTATTNLPLVLTNTESDLRMHTDETFLLRKDKRSGSGDEAEAWHETATIISNNEPEDNIVDVQARMDDLHSHHTIISALSPVPPTTEIISTTRSEFITNENQFLNQELTTDKYQEFITYTGPGIYKETEDLNKPTETSGDWDVLSSTEVSITDIPRIYSITDAPEMRIADVSFPETKHEEFTSENYNTFDQDDPNHSISNQFNISTTKEPSIEDENSVNMRVAGNNDDEYIENLISTTLRLPVHEEIKEADIKIPKIITKELMNGSVISNVVGYEILPNSDFVNITDVSLYENSTEMRSGTDATEESTSPLRSGLLGPLYIIFGEEKIPTRLVEASDGGINLALDGETLCDKILTKEDSSLLLVKLCSCVRDIKYTTDLSKHA